MPIPAQLQNQLRLPLIAAPMFLISSPRLALACCKAGIVGSFPALNQRSSEGFEQWLMQMNDELAQWQAQQPSATTAPYAVNLVVHRTNPRWQADLELCVKHQVPIVITSLGAASQVVEAVHSYGGLVFHDVTNQKHARKAAEAGVDGIIAVSAGAGGHAGQLSPFALIQELRQWFEGPIALSGSIASGASILAAQAMGADLAYIGSLFIASQEANAVDGYKRMIVDSNASDIVYSNLFTGVHGNYLAPSIVNAGMDPANLPESDPSKMNFGSGTSSKSKAWKDIWGCGQGIGVVDDVLPAAEHVARLTREYEAAKEALRAKM